MPVLTVKCETREYEFEAAAGRPLTELLRENGVPLPRWCGGKGICRHCVLLLRRGSFEIGGDVITVEEGDEIPALACETKLGYADAEVALPHIPSKE